LLLRGARLRMMVAAQAQRGGWAQASAVTALALSLNTFLPFRLGDVSRLYLMNVCMGLSVRNALLASIAERWFDVTILLLALVASLALHPLHSDPGQLAALPGYAAAVALAAVALVTVSLTIWPGLRHSADGLRMLPPAARARLSSALDSFAAAVAGYLRPNLLAGSFALTAAIWAALLLEYFAVFRAMGAEIFAASMVAGFALFMFTFSINVVPGQLGTYEALFVASFTLAGFGQPDQALAMAITAHFVNGVLLTVFGAVSFARLDVAWPDLWRRRRQGGRERLP
jgi:uncharacterized protein (TIRG00374 family)